MDGDPEFRLAAMVRRRVRLPRVDLPQRLRERVRVAVVGFALRGHTQGRISVTPLSHKISGEILRQLVQEAVQR